MKTTPKWLASYTEPTMEANYNIWVMGVPQNAVTGLPTIIGSNEEYPPGSVTSSPTMKKSSSGSPYGELHKRRSL